MPDLSNNEKRLLLFLFVAIFVVANLFAGFSIFKRLKGSGGEIEKLEDELAENKMYLEEKELWDRRRDWLNANMPPPIGSALTAQSELAQAIQTDLIDRKLKIERQNLPEAVNEAWYDEVAVYFRIRGDLAKINEWLSTLQSPEKFLVLKTFELELDTRSKETEPQAVCEITVARWFTPKDQALPEPETPAEKPEPAEGDENMTKPESPEKKGGKENGQKVELTER